MNDKENNAAQPAPIFTPHPEDVTRRFFGKINKDGGIVSEDLGHCWTWLGGNLKGYGAIKIGQKQRSAHRVSWEIHFGEIPKGLWVLHRCNTTMCCNPNHLVLGTQRDNERHKDVQNRRPKGAQCDPWRHKLGHRGEKSASSKVTEENVREIRRLYAEGAKLKELAALFPALKEAAISHIVTRRNWAHVL